MTDHGDLFDDLFGMEEEEVRRKEVQRAPYGYVGAKYRSIAHLMKHLPYRYKWVDHFGGSGVVTLNRNESKLEVFNDRYSGVSCFYRCLQKKDTCDALIERLKLTCHSREEFYYCRDTWMRETDTVERAAKWFFMMRTSVISKGHCYARSTNSLPPITLPKALELFYPVHYRFRDVIVENLDFEVCFNDFDSHNCVHYFDPPYLETDTGIYSGSWTEKDLKRLLNCIENAKGFCALSHYPHKLIDSQPFWTKKEVWHVPITAEVRAFSKENYKENYKNVQQTDFAKEVLYIKE